MRRFLFFIIFFLAILHFGELFAVEKYQKPTRDEVLRAAAPCKSTGSKIPINDTYVCPSGEFSRDGNITKNDETVECSIQIALSFGKIDQIAKNWLRQIQDLRVKDAQSWNKNIDDVLWAGENSLSDQYLSVCAISNYTLSSDKNTTPYGCARTLSAFPETSCREIAAMKIAQWEKASAILMSTNIYKSFQNDKDTYMGKTKSIYDKVLDKTYQYKLMVGNAVSKFSRYIRQTVQ